MIGGQWNIDATACRAVARWLKAHAAALEARAKLLEDDASRQAEVAERARQIRAAPALAAARAAAGSNDPIRSAAFALDVPEETIRRHITLQMRDDARKGRARRDAAIIRLWRGGHSTREIGRRYSLSKSRVAQIVRAGLTSASSTA